MKSTQWMTAVTIAGLSLTLVACGGGGSDQPQTATRGAAQGAYVGTGTSTGSAGSVNFALNAVVLDDDESWVVYGQRSASGYLTVYGMVQAQGTANNGTYTAGNAKVRILAIVTGRSGDRDRFAA